MAVNFVKFEGGAGNLSGYINPEHVSYIRPKFRGSDESEVYLTGGSEFVTVKGTIDEVAKKLKNAGMITAVLNGSGFYEFGSEPDTVGNRSPDDKG